VILGVEANIFDGKVSLHPSSELRVFRHLWYRSDAPCSSILRGSSQLPVAIDENLGKFEDPQLPYQKSQENIAAGRHPFGPSTTTWKNHNHSVM